MAIKDLKGKLGGQHKVPRLYNGRKHMDALLKMNNFFRQMAVGTGVGVRYDLDYFVIRLDWGFGLHVPYQTDRSGWFNIPSFKQGNSLHLAIGYPF